MNKAVILGCNSFSGSHLTFYLLKKNFKILGFSRSIKEDIFLPYKKSPYLKNFNFIKFNLKTDFNLIKHKIDKFRPEFIIDFSGQGMVAQSFDDPINWIETNVISKLKIMEYVIKSSYLKKYIKISTPEVYGSINRRVSPAQLYNPSSPYALSHSMIDTLFNFYNKKNQFPVVTGRFANFYGPNQQLYRLIPKSILKFRKNEKFFIDGDGESKRSFLFIDDFCNGVYGLISKGLVGKTYHFSENKTYAIKKIVSMICDCMSIDFSKNVDFGPPRYSVDQNYNMNCNETLNTLNWSPKVSLKDGLEKTIDWYLNNFQYLKNISSNFKYKK